MAVDIFIKTYHKDFVWLEWCLKSIKKFASEFRDVVIVTEEGHLLPETFLEILPLKVFYVPFPEKTPDFVEHGLGYLWQQNIKLTWYNYTDADEILILDSDEMLTQPTTPKSFKTDNKINWYYKMWHKMGDGACWKASTDKLLCMNTAYCGMCITGFFLTRSMSLSFKQHMCELHETTNIWDIFIKYNMPTASEYSVLGCYILKSNNADYNKIFEDDLSKTFNNTIKKDWSWGGLTPENIEERKKILSYTHKNTVAFITLSNSGYIEYTINCLKSLESVNSSYFPKVYCIGSVGSQKLQSLGYSTELIDEEENSNFQNIRCGNWSNIVYNKFVIIHKNLLTHDFVCITDGDIVYKNPEFMNYLLDNIGNHELLIQNEMMSNNETDVLCSGFMFIKSTQNTISLFNTTNVEEFRSKTGWGDQLYVNDVKHKMDYKVLPLELFPNGRFYYENHKTINPFLVHFNWVKGHEKKEKMKTHEAWFNSSCELSPPQET